MQHRSVSALSPAYGMMHSPGCSIMQKSFCTKAIAEKARMNTGELPKNFDFTSEERIYNWWETQGYFQPNSELRTDAFVISMPPPNVTGNLHMGHAMFVTLEDIMIRHWRMRGRPTLWLPGTDHAGIATQLVVEKMLNAKGIKRADIGRNAFIENVWEWKQKYGSTITSQLRKLGASCDWTRERFTLDDGLSKAVIRAFVHLHEKGLIYRGSYMVNWSPNLQTAVSDLEVEYTEEPGTLYYFKYPLAGSAKDEYIPVATTRPETLLGDTAVAVHPEDVRYSKYIGRTVTVPMSGGREIPVVADEYVDRNFGTGALKITPGHDPNDYAIAQRLKLPILNILNKDGSLNEAAGLYSGLDRYAARKKLWEDMEAASLTLKTEPYTLRVPRSQRGGEVIEPLVSKQWFVTMEPLAKKGLDAVESGALRIVPSRFEKTYVQWLTNIKDWCISRQLWWGHRLPVWYIVGNEDGAYVVAENEEAALMKARQKHGDNVQLEQDPDVLDTWFSSGLWPFSTLGWPDDSSDDLTKFYPTSVLETGHDILFFWVARMVMMGIELTGRSPFSTVYLHGLVRDSKGRKMSKSLGNVIDPRESVKEYGTDALRFTLATGTAPGQDINLSMERLGANKAFTNKLWNAGKFITQNASGHSSSEQLELHRPQVLQALPLCERWVLTKAHMLIDSVTSNYENLEFVEAGRTVYDFFWSEFADWYIEASKTRLYKKDNASGVTNAISVLVHVFTILLKLLHPFMPFVTEELWQAMPRTTGALIVADWPELNLPKDMSSLSNFEELQALVKAIRNARAEYSVEPGRRIRAAIVAREEMIAVLQGEIDVLVALCKLDEAAVQIRKDIPDEASKAVHLVVSEGLEAYLPLADMIDVQKELERVTKQMAKLESEYKSNVNRLASSEFVDKAPTKVVETVRQKAKDAEEKLQLLNKRAAFLQSA